MHDKNINHPTLQSIIFKALMSMLIFIFIIAFITSAYLSFKSLQILRQNNDKKIHELMTALLRPSLALSDTTEVRRLLSLISSGDDFFAVINDENDILLNDYNKINIVKNSLKNTVANKIGCNNIKNKIKFGRNQIYLVYCTPLLANSIEDIEDGIKAYQSYGVLLTFSKEQFIVFDGQLSVYILIVVFASLLIGVLAFRYIIQKRVIRPLMLLKDKITNKSTKDEDFQLDLGGIVNAPDDILKIKKAFENLLYSLKKEISLRNEDEKQTALYELAAKVAHDIRSPLAVMEMVITNETNFTANNLPILKEAIQSVRDLANNLISRYRMYSSSCGYQAIQQDAFEEGDIKRPVLLSLLIDTVISHKKQEWKNYNVELKKDISLGAMFIRIYASPAKLTSLLSNLLNNSFESFANNGIIVIELKIANDDLILCIKDNGKGIPSCELAFVKEGKSLKHAGKGLGLSSAVAYMAEVGGGLKLQSAVGEGTEVFLSFPVLANNKIYPASLSFSSDTIIFILDDDESIHKAWEKRLSKLSITRKHFYSYHEGCEWYKKNKCKNILFLVDYSLGSFSKTGLDFLRSVDIKNNRCLVTSYTEDISIQKIAQEEGVKLVPKLLIGEIHLFDL